MLVSGLAVGLPACLDFGEGQVVQSEFDQTAVAAPGKPHDAGIEDASSRRPTVPPFDAAVGDVPDAQLRPGDRDATPGVEREEEGEPSVTDPMDGGSDSGAWPDSPIDAGGDSGTGPGHPRRCSIPVGSEFETADLLLEENWSSPGQVVPSTTVVDGKLVVEPPPGTGWFGTRQGYLLATSVCGDFVVETDVSAQAVALDEPPNLPLSTAGLMVRYPDDDPMCDSGEENWETLSVGTRVSLIGMQAKTTTCSRTQRRDVGNTRDVNSARLRFCRIDNTLRMFFLRPGDTAWRSAGTSSRDGLPETLQVGVVASAWGAADMEPNATQADLRASFRYLRFSAARPTTATDCTSLPVWTSAE